MNLPALFAAFGRPFPAGGRVAAMADMDAAGLNPTPSGSLGDWTGDKTRQPTNRGLVTIRVLNPLNATGA